MLAKQIRVAFFKCMNYFLLDIRGNFVQQCKKMIELVVLVFGQHHEIGDIVVGFIAINMMNVLMALQGAAKYTFHYQSMLGLIVAVALVLTVTNFYHDVAIMTNTLSPQWKVRAVTQFCRVNFVSGSRRPILLMVIRAICGFIADTYSAFCTSFALPFAVSSSPVVKLFSLTFVTFSFAPIDRGATIRTYSLAFLGLINLHICLQIKTLFAGASVVLAEGTRMTGKECQKQYMRLAHLRQTVSLSALHYTTGVVIGEMA